jgi:uncharacterized short protein YbdD (DUF466 family)
MLLNTRRLTEVENFNDFADIYEMDAEIQRLEDTIRTLQVRRIQLLTQRTHIMAGVSAGDYVVVEEKRVNPETFTRTYSRFEGVVLGKLGPTAWPMIRVLHRGSSLSAQTREITPGTRITNRGQWKGETNEIKM